MLKGRGKEVYPGLKKEGGGGFYQTKFQKQLLESSVFFLLREVSFSSLKNLFK